MTEQKKWYKNTTKSRMSFILSLGFIIIGITILISNPLYRPKQIQQEKPKIQKIDTELQSTIRIINKKQSRIDPILVKPIAEAILKYSKQYKFPPELILAIINRESNFKPLSVSSENCIGLMQINEKWHKEKLKKIGINSNQLFHIDPNIAIGCMILSEYYKQTHSIKKALTKYVGGSHKGYILDILSDYTDLTISQSKF